MARANSELSDAKKIAEGLASQLVQFRVRARSQRKEIDRLKKHVGGEERWTLNNDEAGSVDQYLEVVRELEAAKLELSNLKLGMASALEEKKKAEKKVQVLWSRMESEVKVMEELEMKIEAANEEHVLIELARVEASKEYRELGAHRKAEKENFARKLAEAKARRKDMIKEIKNVEGLETKLEVTTSDLEVLQNEMVFVRAMSKNLLSNKSSAHSSIKNKVETESSYSLQNAKAELDAAKKELALLKEEGFRFMSSMDVVREEMNQFSSEVSHLKALEEEAYITVQNLHSELLKAKSKLEAASAADRKSKTILSNLLLTIECSRNDAGSSKEEQKITGETESLKSETEQNDIQIDVMRKKLLAAVQELGTAKASEALALERLRFLSEKALYHRDSPGVLISKITISHGEHEYLRNGAEGAKELAVKKIEAAQAWFEALGNSQKEALFQTEIVRKEIQELKELEEKEVHKVKEALTAKEGEQGKHRLLEEEFHHSHIATSQFKLTAPRKFLKANGITHSSRRSVTHRRSISPGEALMDEIGGLVDVTVLDGESQLMEWQKLKSLKANAITHSSRRSVTRRRRPISPGPALIAETKGLSDVIVVDKESQLVELHQLKSLKENATTRSSRRSTTHRRRSISPGQALVSEIGGLSDVIVLDKESQEQHKTAPARKSPSSSRRSSISKTTSFLVHLPWLSENEGR